MFHWYFRVRVHSYVTIFPDCFVISFNLLFRNRIAEVSLKTVVFKTTVSPFPYCWAVCSSRVFWTYSHKIRFHMAMATNGCLNVRKIHFCLKIRLKKLLASIWSNQYCGHKYSLVWLVSILFPPLSRLFPYSLDLVPVLIFW